MEQLYTVLLVDDEEEVTQVIMNRINWEELGFQVIGSATNGVKALEMAEKYQPDVVMTDIKMPFMNGLELAEQLRKEYPSTRILLFTGFDEFEYAREAVHLEVEEYILKPVNAAELTDVFTRLKQSLDQERAEKQNIEKLQNYYLESLPLLQSNFYTALIEGRVTREDFPKYMNDYQVELDGPAYCCAVFHTSTHHVPEGMTPLLLSIAVQRQIPEHMNSRWRGKFFTYEGNSVMIVQMRSENEVADLTDECDRFCRWAGRLLNAVVTIGIGSVVTNPIRLDLSYGGAREAVSYRVLYGTGRAINIREIAPQEAGSFEPGDEDTLQRLFKSIHLEDRAAIASAVDAYLRSLTTKARSVQQYEGAVMELLGSIYRFAAGNHIDLTELSRPVGNLYENVPQMDIHTLQKWLLGLSYSFAEALSRARNSTSKSYVDGARAYVRANYSDSSLSLDKVCGSLGVSSSYFSSVFKRETGNSFIGYLTDYRMQKAAALLLETDDKNYIVAKKVGYEDANYFSYVFKKAFGMSPTRYRAGHRASADKAI